MFRDDIKIQFDKITPSAELTEKIAAMMREEAAKPRQPIYINAAKIVAMAAAVCLVTALSIVAVNSIQGGGSLLDTSSAPMANASGVYAADEAAYEPIYEADGAAETAEASYTAAPAAAEAPAYAPEKADDMNGEAEKSASDRISAASESIMGLAPSPTMTSAAAAPLAPLPELFDNADYEEEFEPADDGPVEEGELTFVDALPAADYAPEPPTELPQEPVSGAAAADEAVAKGGDGLTEYRFPVNALIGSIDMRIIRLVGVGNYEKWLSEKNSAADTTDLDNFANLYSLIRDFDLDREQVGEILRSLREMWEENGITPCFADGDIELILYGSKQEVSERFVTASSVCHNGKLYTPEWFNTHSADDYRAEGIPPEKISEKLGNMLESSRFVNLDDLARNVGEYLGTNVAMPVFDGPN